MNKTSNAFLKLSLGILAYLCYRESYELFERNTLQHALFVHYGLEIFYWCSKIASVALGALVLRYLWKKDTRGIKYSILFLVVSILSLSVEWGLLNKDPEFALNAYIKSREARGFPVNPERAAKAMEMMRSHFNFLFLLIYGMPLLGLYLKKRALDSEESRIVE